MDSDFKKQESMRDFLKSANVSDSSAEVSAAIESAAEHTESKHDLMKKIADLEAQLAQVKQLGKFYVFEPTVITDSGPRQGRMALRLPGVPTPILFWKSGIEEILKIENVSKIRRAITENSTLMENAEATYLAKK